MAVLCQYIGLPKEEIIAAKSGSAFREVVFSICRHESVIHSLLLTDYTIIPGVITMADCFWNQSPHFRNQRLLRRTKLQPTKCSNRVGVRRVEAQRSSVGSNCFGRTSKCQSAYPQRDDHRPSENQTTQRSPPLFA